MFIRRARTRTAEDGTQYFSCRLVRAERHGDKIRQKTLLNLGSHYPIQREQWPILCARISQLLSKQESLHPADCGEVIEQEAQRIAAQLISRSPDAAESPTAELHNVEVDSLEMVRPRSAGVEQVALWAMQQLGFEPLLERLGLTRMQRATAMGSIIGRMAVPGSERSTWRWLCQRSALGEMLGVDFETQGMTQIYRASDALMAHREKIESHLFGQVSELFALEHTVTLYDLTNTYFEGAAVDQPRAKRGHSKEKRSDCPLLTLGMVLDGSGFVRRSEVFSGNAIEGDTLQQMLKSLQAPQQALVVMDAGIATADNLTWLRDHNYRYLVVSRERSRKFDAELSIAIETRSKQKVHLHKVVDEAQSECRLYCYSPQRARKEEGISKRFAQRFEDNLKKLHEGLSRPRTRKGVNHIWERIGRLRAKSRGIGQHYQVDVEVDPDSGKAIAVTWKQAPVADTRFTDPGVYCLRSNVLDWDEETMWRTYTMLTDLEAVFRSLKSELGLRPIYHRTQTRSDGHLFISVVAYQLVQTIRRRLGESGETASWTTIRKILEGQQRVTATFRRGDGRVVHIRKGTRAEPDQLKIYRALDLDPVPGKTNKMLV